MLYNEVHSSLIAPEQYFYKNNTNVSEQVNIIIEQQAICFNFFPVMFSSTFFISLILSGAAQVVQPTIFSNTSIPSTANYAHTIQLASTSSGEFNLSWTLQGQDIKFLISISGPTMNFGWVSIGFGPDMRKSEMIVVHQVPNGSLIHVHKATGNEYVQIC